MSPTHQTTKFNGATEMHRSNGLMRQGTLVGAAILGLLTSATAGVPQPPLTFYGKVVGGGSTITEGAIQVSLTPSGGGATISSTASLASLNDGLDTFSYKAKVPVIDNTPGGQSATGKLVVPSGSITYDRRITVARPGQPDAIVNDTVVLSPTQHIGNVVRLDVDLAGATTPTPTPSPTPTPIPTSTPTPTPAPGGGCEGDADKSGFVNLDDYRSVRDNFGQSGSEFGDANGDGFVNLNDYRAVRDNFGQACTVTKSETPLLLAGDKVTKAAAAGTRLFVEAPATGTLGNTVTVQLRLDADTEEVGIASVFLLYDTAKLDFVSGSINTTTFNNTTFTTTVNDDAVNGVVSFSAASNAAVTTNNVLVATITFTATDSGLASFAYSTANPRISELTDSSLTNIPSGFDGADTMILAANTALVSILPNTQTIGVGANFSAQVALTPNGTGAAGAGVFIAFDPAVLDFVSGTINTGAFNNANFTSIPTEATPGVVSFAAFANSAIPDNTTTMATLQFVSLVPGITTLDLLEQSPSTTEVTDDGLNPILTAVADGTVIVDVNAPTPTPTATPTPTPTATPTQTTVPTPTPMPGAPRVLSVPTNIVGAAGSEVEVRVAIDNANSVSGYRVALAWNPALASYVANSTAGAGTLSQGCFAPSANSDIPGTLTISSACTNELSGAGNIVRFRVQLAGGLAAGSTIPIVFDTTQTRLNDGVIASTTSNGLITVASPFLWGDVACPPDGIAGTLDVSAILRFDAGLLTSFPCFNPVYTAPAFPPGGDVNGDSIMGVLDASLVLRYDALLISRFPADVNGDSFGPDAGAPVTKEMQHGKSAPVEVRILDAVADGASVRVPVTISDGAGVYGYRLSISYDHAALQAPIAALPEELGDWFRSNVLTHLAGTSVVSAAGTSELGAGEHTIAYFLFPVEPSASGTTRIQLDVDATRVNDGEIGANLHSGSVALSSITDVSEWVLY